ncbi:MAG: YSC84-related protein, partial [Thermoanaerobaculia bacterium]
MRSRNTALLCLLLVAMFGVATTGFAYDPKRLDEKVANGIREFEKIVKNSDEVMAESVGVLVCPTIAKAGLGIGVEKGNCALQIDGKTVEYWRASGASLGLTVGVESGGLLVAFMEQAALDKFRESDKGYQFGVDGSITVATLGESGNFSVGDRKKPIIGFSFNPRGLMADASIRASKLRKIGTEADVAKFQDPFHRFVVTAELRDPASASTGGAQTMQMTIDIDGWVTIAQIEAMQALIRDEGTAAASMALAEMPPLGQVKHTGKSLPIQYARALQIDDNHYRVVLATTGPMGFSWAKQEENSATVFQLDLDSKRLGNGVMVLDPELGWDDKLN